jgi:CRP-like cAMP-binding protein
MSAVRRPAGSYIARAGADHARFGVILEGSAVVLRDHATVVARSGEHLGSELLCGSAAVASSAIAISDVELAALGGPGFDRMVRDLPVVAERLAATTSCRRPSRGRVSSG